MSPLAAPSSLSANRLPDGVAWPTDRDDSTGAAVGATVPMSDFTAKPDFGEAIYQSLGTLAGHIRAIADNTAPAPCPTPIDRRVSGVADSSGNLLLLFDPVPQGAHKWSLERLTVGGVLWSTSAAGTATVYKTSGSVLAPDNGGPSTADVMDYASSLPAVAFYLTPTNVPLFPGEMLAVYITGGTSGQQYQAAAQFIQS